MVCKRGRVVVACPCGVSCTGARHRVALTWQRCLVAPTLLFWFIVNTHTEGFVALA